MRAVVCAVRQDLRSGLAGVGVAGFAGVGVAGFAGAGLAGSVLAGAGFAGVGVAGFAGAGVLAATSTGLAGSFQPVFTSRPAMVATSFLAPSSVTSVSVPPSDSSSLPQAAATRVNGRNRLRRTSSDFRIGYPSRDQFVSDHSGVKGPEGNDTA